MSQISTNTIVYCIAFDTAVRFTCLKLEHAFHHHSVLLKVSLMGFVSQSPYIKCNLRWLYLTVVVR